MGLGVEVAEVRTLFDHAGRAVAVGHGLLQYANVPAQVNDRLMSLGDAPAVEEVCSVSRGCKTRRRTSVIAVTGRVAVREDVGLRGVLRAVSAVRERRRTRAWPRRGSIELVSNVTWTGQLATSDEDAPHRTN